MLQDSYDSEELLGGIIKTINMNYKYNYVFFNSTESLYKKPDGTDYDTICVWDFMNSDSVQLVLCPLEHKSAFLRFLYGA